MPKKISIIAPHRDDEMYGCWSVVGEAIMDKDIELTIYFVTHGVHQDKRKPAYSVLDKYNNIKLVDLNLFVDGEGSITSLWVTCSTFDKIVENSDVVYFCEASSHPDHQHVYSSMLGAIRYRNSLPKHLEVYTYSYYYIDLGTQFNVFKGLSELSLSIKKDLYNKLNKLDNIAKDSCNSWESILAAHKFMGSKFNFKYADCFRLILKY